MSVAVVSSGDLDLLISADDDEVDVVVEDIEEEFDIVQIGGREVEIQRGCVDSCCMDCCCCVDPVSGVFSRTFCPTVKIELLKDS